MFFERRTKTNSAAKKSCCSVLPLKYLNIRVFQTVSSFQVSDFPLKPALQQFKVLTSEKLHIGLDLHPLNLAFIPLIKNPWQ